MTTTPREVPVREAEIERIAAVLPDAISAGGGTVQLSGPYRGLLAKRLYDAGLRSQQYLDGLVAALRDAAQNNHVEGFHDEDGGPESFMDCSSPACSKVRLILEGARATDDGERS